jgi:purine nucleosidase/pyrimidine-specific ribonucleoside hydrolase
MKHILVDTDPGVDDAFALIYALNSPELQVEAITTVSGNLPVDICSRNLMVVLQVIGLHPDRFPLLAQGESRPLIRPPVGASDVHGQDGLGNTTTMLNADGSRKYPEAKPQFSAASAVDTILKMAAKFRDDLTIVAIAPLTNIAKAIIKNPAQMRKVKEIVLMGGAFDTYGNITLSAEFNIFVDPHAAQIVCDSGIPTVFVPLDVTHQVRVLRDRLKAAIAGRDDLLSSFLLDSTLAVMAFDSRFEDFYGMHLHDPLPLIYLTHPELFQAVKTRVDIETEGVLTQGKTLAELRTKRLRAPSNALVLTGVKTEEALKHFYQRILKL